MDFYLRFNLNNQSQNKICNLPQLRRDFIPQSHGLICYGKYSPLFNYPPLFLSVLYSIVTRLLVWSSEDRIRGLFIFLHLQVCIYCTYSALNKYLFSLIEHKTRELPDLSLKRIHRMSPQFDPSDALSSLLCVCRGKPQWTASTSTLDLWFLVGFANERPLQKTRSKERVSKPCLFLWIPPINASSPGCFNSESQWLLTIIRIHIPRVLCCS